MRVRDDCEFRFSSATAPDNSPDHSTTSSPDRGSPQFGSCRGRPERTRTPNDGSVPCVTNCLTAPSSGTSGSSEAWLSSTSTATTNTAPIAGSTSVHPTTPPTRSRSGEATRSNDTASAVDSSTRTTTQPETTPSANKNHRGTSSSAPARASLLPRSPSERQFRATDGFSAPSGSSCDPRSGRRAAIFLLAGIFNKVCERLVAELPIMPAIGDITTRARCCCRVW